MSKFLNRNNLWLPCIVFVAILLRILAIIITCQQPNDDWEYGEIASNIVNGHGFSRISDPGGKLEITSSHAPAYPLFLAIFYSIGSTPFIFLLIKLTQLLLSVITIIFLYKLAKSYFDAKTGLICAFILAIYPPYIYSSLKITPSILFLSLFIISIYLFFTKKHILTNILAAFFFAIAVLSDPIGFTLLPVYLLIIIFTKREPIFNQVVFFLAIIILIAPWTIRNFFIHRRLIPVTTQFGINLWIGNNPSATGTDYYRVDNRVDRQYIFLPQTLSRRSRIALDNMTEIERSDFFLSQSLNYIKDNPIAFIGLTARKTLYYWWFPPAKFSGSRDSVSYRIIYMLCYCPLLILGLIGMVLALFRRRLAMVYILLIIILISGIYIITHVGLARYRLPVETLLILPAGYALQRITGRIFKYINYSIHDA